jgi:uncharacterized protein YcsI (UPF0317 family)
MHRDHPNLFVHHDPALLRQAIRANEFNGQTAGQAPGFMQANLAILPREYAADFLRFCQLNPKPCPIVGMSEPGNPHIPALGEDLDIRTDVSQYCLWEHGEYKGDLNDLKSVWREDFVTFAIGCSFSFEEALIDDGIALRHIAEGKNVSMWRTNIQTAPAGPFSGPLVVSMRPMSPADAIRAIQITSRFPNVHGAPVHFGDPAAIGIADITRPDFGDPCEINAGEVPVFWACGVTPQSAIRAAKPPISITHKPGCMLVTDVKNSRLASF